MQLTLSRVSLFISLCLAACDPSGDKSEQAPERQALGKNDNIGSCQPHNCTDPALLGEQGVANIAEDGNCWCDDNCTNVGDCCANAVAVCDVPPKDPPGPGECNDDSEPRVCGDDPSDAPTCPEGQNLALKEGCWLCVEDATCELHKCDDGSVQFIGQCGPDPVCGNGEYAAVREHCRVCVDAESCDPV